MQKKNIWDSRQEKKKQMQAQFRKNVFNCNIELKTLLYKLEDQREKALTKARKAKQENNLVMLKGMKSLLSHVYAQQASMQTMQNNLEILSMQMEVNDSILNYTNSLFSLAKIAKEQGRLATPDLSKLTKKASSIFSAITTKIPELSAISPVPEISQVDANYNAITESELDALIEGDGPISMHKSQVKDTPQQQAQIGTMDDVLNALNGIGSDVNH
jgi:hypothetical protein